MITIVCLIAGKLPLPEIHTISRGPKNGLRREGVVVALVHSQPANAPAAFRVEPRCALAPDLSTAVAACNHRCILSTGPLQPAHRAPWAHSPTTAQRPPPDMVRSRRPGHGGQVPASWPARTSHDQRQLRQRSTAYPNKSASSPSARANVEQANWRVSATQVLAALMSSKAPRRPVACSDSGTAGSIPPSTE